MGKKILLVLAFLLLHSFFSVGMGFPCGGEEYPQLQYGEEKEIVRTEIKEIKTLLRDLGYYEKEVNTRFCPELARVLRQFRETHDLSPEARIDPEFYVTLARVYEREKVHTPAVEEVATEDLLIVINLGERLLYLLEGGQEIARFPVAIGKPSTPSPLGFWKITSMGAKKGSAFGTRWMGLNVPWGVYGIHGTNNPGSIGQAASAGCIRMFNQHVEKLYSLVKHGTKVYITSEPFGVLERFNRRMVMGSVGSEVFAVQKRLRQLGYYEKNADGLFGWYTYKAVKAFQQDNGWEVTGKLEVYQIQEMGLFPYE